MKNNYIKLGFTVSIGIYFLIGCGAPQVTVVKPDKDTLALKDSVRFRDTVQVDTAGQKTSLNLDALRFTADSLYQAGDFDESLRAWMRVLEKAGEPSALTAEAHYYIGNIFYNKQEYQKAELEFKRALKNAPQYVDALLDLGLVYVVKGDYDKAAASFRSVLEILPADSEATSLLEYSLGMKAYDEGLNHFNYGFYDNAIKAFKVAAQYLESDTSMNHMVYFLLGKSYYEKLDYEKAQKMLERSIELKPHSAQAYTELATIYFARRDFKQAVALNRKAIELKPDFAKAYNNLGYIYFSMGNDRMINGKKKDADDYYRESLQYLEKALTLDPGMSGARINIDHVKRILSGQRKVLAYTMFQNAAKTQNNREKIKQLHAIIRQDSTYDDAYNNLGVAYFYEGLADSAVIILEKAIDINPFNPQAHNNLGYILGTMHRYEDALKHLFLAVQIKPDYADAYVNLGYVYMWKEDFQSSRKVWLQLLRLNPNYKEARKGFEELQRREKMLQSGETTTTIEFNESVDTDSTELK